MLTFTKQFAGFYKVNVGCDCIGRDTFANLRKRSDGWHVEFRYSSDGEICRFGGIWNTLTDAKEEVSHITAHSFGMLPAPTGIRRGILATEV